jgi:uncharacterized repeat protein (TIGR03803 family)
MCFPGQPVTFLRLNSLPADEKVSSPPRVFRTLWNDSAKTSKRVMLFSPDHGPATQPARDIPGLNTCVGGYTSRPLGRFGFWRFHGCDTLFKFDIASGRETVLHRFRGGRDGLSPNSLLAYANSTLYGTTVGGGDLGCRYDYVGCGTVFKFDIASGREQVLYRFRGRRDGAAPYNGVIEVNGVLYGTTANGGTNDNGTVFSVSL